MTGTQANLPTIYLDCGQYVAVLYDDGYGQHPTGMIGPSEDMKAVSAAALEWVHDGVEWEARRRAELVYMTAEPKVERDIIIRSEGNRV